MLGLSNKWRRLTSLLRNEGSHSLGRATPKEAAALTQRFLGNSYCPLSTGNGYISTDGLRMVRSPAFKPNNYNPQTLQFYSGTHVVVNFQARYPGSSMSEFRLRNVHLDIGN